MNLHFIEFVIFSLEVKNGIRLTKTQRRVLILLFYGLINSDIAQLIYIQEKSVKFHLTRIYKKLGIQTNRIKFRRQNLFGTLPILGYVNFCISMNLSLDTLVDKVVVCNMCKDYYPLDLLHEDDSICYKCYPEWSK